MSKTHTTPFDFIVRGRKVGTMYIQLNSTDGSYLDELERVAINVAAIHQASVEVENYGERSFAVLYPECVQ